MNSRLSMLGLLAMAGNISGIANPLPQTGFPRLKKSGTATCDCGRTISANKERCLACSDPEMKK